MNHVEFLYQAFKPDSIDYLPEPCDAVCAISGKRITEGYRKSDIASRSTGDVADIFCVPSDWLSVEAARLFKGPRLIAGNILAYLESGSRHMGIKPLVSRDSATEERPCWRDLLQRLEVGTPAVAIFTDDYKRRLWPQACLSTIGPKWQVLANIGDVSRILTLDFEDIQICLGFVEAIYNLGFSKGAIGESLLSTRSFRIAQVVGLARTKRLEERLKSWRQRDEFVIATFVAQKMEGEKNVDK